jgi:hypothetical protein
MSRVSTTAPQRDLDATRIRPIRPSVQAATTIIHVNTVRVWVYASSRDETEDHPIHGLMPPVRCLPASAAGTVWCRIILLFRSQPSASWAGESEYSSSAPVHQGLPSDVAMAEVHRRLSCGHDAIAI